MSNLMGAPNPKELYQLLLDADEAGVRLEMMAGVPIWEFHPSPLHQMVLLDVLDSIRAAPGGQSGCGCYRVSDAYIRFPDDSLKRPDISIFSERPPKTQEALTIVPDAVIEVVSPGSEHKDIDVGPGFYLAQGVKDVVVNDPRTSLVLHFWRGGSVRHTSPVTLTLACGCVVTV